MKRLSIFLIASIFALSSQCSDQMLKTSQQSNMTTDTTHHKFTNELIHETSPYLLQHAHNPVNWYPWGEKALNKAKEENKLLLVSIGYSACHWCHVMEKESFENEEVAAYMNEHFVCIKVDREERPDVDQVYMNAVQLITGRGGWPLNCFALPDGRPFYGGTYFPKKDWMSLLENVANEFKNNLVKVEEYADQLTRGIQQSELISLNKEESEYKSLLTEMTTKWKTQFDAIEGGPDRAPKFPLPNNYEFLLDYAILNNDQEILDHVELTLDKMAFGGIYDQIGGGFARYSTDKIWKVPHFEKMLYDNAQLVSLYSKAYRHFKKDLYSDIMIQSLEFIKRELTGPEGEFYSALDADSEGEEGKFYVWTSDDLEKVQGLNQEVIKSTYNIDSKYKWEDNYILHRQKSYEEVAKELGLDFKDYQEELMASNDLLLKEREKRIRPGLDDKSLTSWNALMISGYTEAYKAKNDVTYLQIAEKNATLIWKKLHQGDGKLLHSYKKGKSSINGFLEDYALTAQAYIDLYEVGYDEIWLSHAKSITQYAIDHFFDSKSSMFYFISDDQNDLVARKMEVNDNVIPASNSVMANVLYKLGLITDNNEWVEISLQMLNNISPNAKDYGSGYSNWAKLMLTQTHSYYEIAISGSDYRSKSEELYAKYLPNVLFLASKKESTLPLLENKYVKGSTLIYVCVDKTCKLPVENTAAALEQITYR